MTGKSDRETANQNTFSQISNFNPNAKNRFDSKNVVPFSPSSLVPAFNKATGKGLQDLQHQRDTNVKQAQKSTTAGLQSRGYGGSILEDAIAKSRSKASEGGTNAIQKFLTSRLGQLPGVMNQANQTGLQIASGGQNTDFQNIMNMFRKFAGLGSASGGLSDSTTLDDIFAGLNTGAGIASVFI